jgi:hypothetical protein
MNPETLNRIEHLEILIQQALEAGERAEAAFALLELQELRERR